MCKYYREIKENHYLFEQNETVLDHRFIACLKWYIRKSIFYRRIYYMATFLSGVGPLISVSLNNLLFDDMKQDWRFFMFLISTVAGMAVLILNMTRAQEKWTNYRTVAEFLKRDRSMCLMEKSYHPEKIEEIERYYAEVIEKYMSAENIRWENSNMNNGKAHGGKEEKGENERKEASEEELKRNQKKPDGL